MLRVLKVLQRLPGGLATKVLAASTADLEHQLSILPQSMHQLAVHAAFPSILCDHSLKLNSAFPVKRSTTAVHAALEAATTAPKFLKKLDLSHIPKQNDTRLLQLIAAACMTASDVSLMFDSDSLQDVASQQPVAPLHEALSHNTALTRLGLCFPDASCYSISFDCLLKALTGLQSLSLAKYQPRGDDSCTSPLPAPACIQHLHLTHLHLGPGFHLMDLPQIMPHLTSLQILHLEGDSRLQEQDLPDLSPLTALQTLKLDAFKKLNALPPLDTLTALQTLEVNFCEMLQQLPSLSTLIALQTLRLYVVLHLREVPPLDTLTALQTLELRSCDKLQGMPSLAAFTALQTLVISISFCGFMHPIPSIDTLTALKKLELSGFGRVQEMPPLATLTALQRLELMNCNRLQRLPSLAPLTALQRLNLGGCFQLLELPPLATLTALQTLDLLCCKKLERIPSLSTLSALQTIDLTYCAQGLESTFQSTLPNTGVTIKRGI
jgi:Leucine-rich repeat (LRR) protein